MDMWIQDMNYGSIKIGGKVYRHDVVMYRNGKRSNVSECANVIPCLCNSGHHITLSQVKRMWKGGMKWLIIGTGFFEKFSISPDVIDFCLEKGCKVSILPTKMAAEVWNKSKGDAVGYFHLVC